LFKVDGRISANLIRL